MINGPGSDSKLKACTSHFLSGSFSTVHDFTRVTDFTRKTIHKNLKSLPPAKNEKNVKLNVAFV